MDEFFDRLEKALKWLGEVLPSFFSALFSMAFRPAKLAQRTHDGATSPLSPPLFLAVAAVLLAKIARIAVFAGGLLVTVLFRACSGDSYPIDKVVFGDYVKSQF